MFGGDDDDEDHEAPAVIGTNDSSIAHWPERYSTAESRNHGKRMLRSFAQPKSRGMVLTMC
jgi:hypothetical protein